jgi:glycosyltransferase involved in cell wall biosynthesis
MSDPASSDLKISVILCAHNPRPAHFQATLDGLRGQDLPFAEWELIVIDNLSTEPISSRYDVSWHAGARVVVESQLGLAHARRRGYVESRGHLIVHSDDDNILAADYLRTAWRIHNAFPQIGNFGSQIIARFDREPRNALEATFGFARQFETDRWSNLIDDNRTMPYGAGMCLRREVVIAYLDQVARDPRRLILGRTGNRFITGEDIDLNYVAVRAGYGTGLFAALSLVHLIPADRMQAAHVIRYGAGNAYSMVILQFLHFGEIRVPRRTVPGTIMFWLRVWLRMSPYDRRMELAMRRARKEAVRDLHAWGWVK